jgi:hypothetical protein
MTLLSSLHQLSNASLLDETVRLAAGERCATAELIAAIGEVDARRLYLGESCSSMFVYCTRVLRLSEHAAYDRIEVARLARRFPVVLEHLAGGSVTLTNLRLIAPHLTAANVERLLQEGAHKSKHDIEVLIARLRPRPDVPAAIRKLPEPKPSVPISIDGAVQTETRREPAGPYAPPAAPATARPAVVQPLAPERYKVQFTFSGEMRDMLCRVQDLMRHTVPNGDLALIFERALRLLHDDLEKRKLAATARPRAGRSRRRESRCIPASVRREVWKRDGGRCAFVGPNGRCAEAGLLEFHHLRPYAAGGLASVENIELRCRAHNQYEAELFFGERMPILLRERRAEWPCGNWSQDQLGGEPLMTNVKNRYGFKPPARPGAGGVAVQLTRQSADLRVKSSLAVDVAIFGPVDFGIQNAGGRLQHGSGVGAGLFLHDDRDGDRPVLFLAIGRGLPGVGPSNTECPQLCVSYVRVLFPEFDLQSGETILRHNRFGSLDLFFD